MSAHGICRYCKAVCYKDNAISRKVGRRLQTIYVCDECMKKMIRPVKIDK